MQTAIGLDSLGLARARARRWLRVFQQLVRVLDRLGQQPRTMLGSALVFLVQRALGHLEAGEPIAPLPGPRPEDLDEAECGGEELRTAVELARFASDRRDDGGDPASAELETLLVLAGSLIDAPDSGAFEDLAVPAEQIVREYRGSQRLAAEDVLRVELFPVGFRRRWAALLQAAARCEPLERLRLELSIMKVIHGLYAMAIGYRRAAAFGRADPDGDAWFAFTMGESMLKSQRA
jgi:hypothetical protein